MLKLKKILCCFTSAMIIIAASVFTIYADSENNGHREVIATFKFDSTDKIPGSALGGSLGLADDGVYNSTTGNGTMLLKGLKWSDKSVKDADGNEIGIVPQCSSGVSVDFLTEGYQNIEINFDVGVLDEDNSELGVLYYNDNPYEMDENAHFSIKDANTINHCRIQMKGSRFEHRSGKFNSFKFYFYKNNTANDSTFYINNIEITGTKCSADGKRVTVYGDINDDSEISIADATALQKKIVNAGYYVEIPVTMSPSIRWFNDVNGDSTLNVMDVTCIQKYLADLDGGGKTGLIYPGTDLPYGG